MSKTWIDKKYIDLAALHLPLFSWKTDHSANFRCIICGDSKKSATKTRGYFIYDTNRSMWFYKCHNCGASLSMSNFLKLHLPLLYDEYKFEKYKDTTEETKFQAIISEPVEASESDSKQESYWEHLTPLFDLNSSHEAIQYVRGRQIPTRAIKHMWFTPNYAKFIAEFNPKYKPDKKGRYRIPTDPRIVLIMRDKDGKPTCVQGRRIRESKNARYITIKKNESASKLYGLDRIDESKPVIVVEGPIDSLFLPNCIALCGGDIGTSLQQFDKDNIILAFDNEPRSKDTLSRMKKAIELDYKVVFWNIPTRYKDINDMVKNGFSVREILEQICKLNVRGLQAQLRFSEWAKYKTKPRRRSYGI